MTARADTDYHLRVGNTQVTSGNTSGSGWSFDPASNTLTLNGANITSSNSSAIKYESGAQYPLKIEISSDNIIGGCTTGTYSGIEDASNKGIIITGNGTLSAVGHYGIHSSGPITINGNGAIEAEGVGEDSCGIRADNASITINGGTVTAKVTNGTGRCFGIATNSGNVVISGGTVTSTGNLAGIYTDEGSVTIENNCTVVATGTDTNANSDSNGILSDNGITIKGGNVTTSGKYGLYSDQGDITISGGEVTATTIGNGYGHGIYTLVGDVIIEGGDRYCYRKECRNPRLSRFSNNTWCRN